MLRATISEDFSSIPAGGIKTIFRTDVTECFEWDGDFASRKRRSIEEELGEAAEDSFAMLPLNRQRRQAPRRPAPNAGPKGGKKGTMGKGPGKKVVGGKGPRGGKGPKGLAARGGNGPGGKGGKAKGKAKGKGKDTKGGKSSIDKGVYNSLWCVDLAVQKYLQTCVENTLTNGESWNI